MSGEDDFAGVETYRLQGPSTQEEPARRFLLVLGESPRVIELRAGASLRIGRAPDSDVVLADRAVSRNHAMLHVSSDVQVEDLGSANGLLVAGARCAPGGRARVPPGSTIELGGSLLVLHEGAAPPSLGSETPDDDREAPASVDLGDHVVFDEAMARLYEVVARIAPTRLSVLLLGETGAGKEVVAAAVHERSSRAKGPFVKVNCAAIAGQLLESELFGHVRGAFTGADRARRGLIEAASGGTLLLDEVGEMSRDLQAKLLRVIEEQKVRPLGSNDARAVDVRFVAATNRDLDAEVERGTFRRDLYHRLNGIRLEVPPLRKRKGEIIPLAELFLSRASATPPALSRQAADALREHSWPGNVRELRNAVEHALAMCTGATLRTEHLPAEITGREAKDADDESVRAERITMPMDLRDDLAAIEKQRIIDALEQCDGNQSRAAKLLGMPRRTLISRIEAYGLPRPRKGKRA